MNAHRVLDRREWRRLVTAPLLHADLPHLASNCTGLVLEGLPLERRLGSVQFTALLASCAAVSQGLYRECRFGRWCPPSPWCAGGMHQAMPTPLLRATLGVPTTQHWQSS